MLPREGDGAHRPRDCAHPDLVLIENGWRSPKEQRPGALQLSHVRQIETVIDNPDAEPVPVMPCDAAKPAIIVYGKNLGATLTVCTDRNCPAHDPATAARLAEEQAENPAPIMAPVPDEETEEEAAEREREYARRRQEYEEEQHRKEEERKLQNQREHEAHEAERARLVELHKTRLNTVDRIVANAPEMFTAIQLRTLLSALIHLDPSMFEDFAEHQVADDENNQQSAEEILSGLLASIPDGKLTGFALRLALTAHASIPRQGDSITLPKRELRSFHRLQRRSSRRRRARRFNPSKPQPKKKLRHPRPQRTQAARKQPSGIFAKATDASGVLLRAPGETASVSRRVRKRHCCRSLP